MTGLAPVLSVSLAPASVPLVLRLPPGLSAKKQEVLRDLSAFFGKIFTLTGLQLQYDSRRVLSMQAATLGHN